jgi:hypothetical protein
MRLPISRMQDGSKRRRDDGPRDYGDLACAGGKPAAHPLHRYITYEKRRFSTRYITVTCRYTGLRTTRFRRPGLALGGNRRHTRYTVTLPMRNGALRPVTCRYMPLHGCGPKRPRDYGPRDHCANLECGKLGPAFAPGAIYGEQSGGKPPHSKKSRVSSRRDNRCPRSLGSVIPTNHVEKPKMRLSPGGVPGYVACMSIDQIASEALRLPARDRALLAGSLWESLEDPFAAPSQMEDTEAAARALERDRQIERGEVQAVSHEDLMAQLRRRATQR